jgi:hypothetical protein
MATESPSGKKPTSRRYSPEEKAAAVRTMRALRAELGTEQGTVSRVARQLGYGVESVRSWVRQADIDDGYAPGLSTALHVAQPSGSMSTGYQPGGWPGAVRMISSPVARAAGRQSGRRAGPALHS